MDFIIAWYALGWVAVGVEYKTCKYGALTPILDFLLPPVAIITSIIYWADEA